MKNILLLGTGHVGKNFAHLAANEFQICVFDAFPFIKGFPILDKTSLDELTPPDFSPYDLVVNCLPVSHNDRILSLVSESKCKSYMDFSTNALDVPEHFAYQSHFTDGLLLANTGIAPGLDNLLIAHLIKKGAKKIQVYLIEHVFADKITFASWCEEDALISLHDLPISCTQGEIKKHKNFSDPERVSTTQGEFVCYRFFGEEILTLGKMFDKVNIDFKAGGSEIEAARQLFLNETTREETNGTVQEETDGIFGLKIRSDVGNIEIFLKPTRQLRQEGKLGNHISFHTAYVSYTILRTALKYNLKGMYFPEMLPEEVQNEILKEIKKHSCVWEI